MCWRPCGIFLKAYTARLSRCYQYTLCWCSHLYLFTSILSHFFATTYPGVFKTQDLMVNLRPFPNLKFPKTTGPVHHFQTYDERWQQQIINLQQITTSLQRLRQKTAYKYTLSKNMPLNTSPNCPSPRISTGRMWSLGIS